MLPRGWTRQLRQQTLNNAKADGVGAGRHNQRGEVVAGKRGHGLLLIARQGGMKGEFLCRSLCTVVVTSSLPPTWSASMATVSCSPQGSISPQSRLSSELAGSWGHAPGGGPSALTLVEQRIGHRRGVLEGSEQRWVSLAGSARVPAVLVRFQIRWIDEHSWCPRGVPYPAAAPRSGCRPHLRAASPAMGTAGHSWPSSSAGAGPSPPQQPAGEPPHRLGRHGCGEKIHMCAPGSRVSYEKLRLGSVSNSFLRGRRKKS